MTFRLWENWRRKTAGVLGDDLSLNAQQVSGVRANRELPVVWGVAKGSFINKVILVPLALLISAFIPGHYAPADDWRGVPVLRGCRKSVAYVRCTQRERHPGNAPAASGSAGRAGSKTFERDKVKGAIRTDFILSAEIVAITLGIVSEAPLMNRC